MNAAIANGSDKAAQRIADVTAECGISLVASLPDGWITRLITQFAGMRAFATWRSIARNRRSGFARAHSSAASARSR